MMKGPYTTMPTTAPTRNASPFEALRETGRTVPPAFSVGALPDMHDASGWPWPVLAQAADLLMSGYSEHA